MIDFFCPQLVQFENGNLPRVDDEKQHLGIANLTEVLG